MLTRIHIKFQNGKQASSGYGQTKDNISCHHVIASTEIRLSGLAGIINNVSQLETNNDFLPCYDALCLDNNLGTNMYPVSKKRKSIMSSSELVHGSFGGDVGIDPYGFCGRLEDGEVQPSDMSSLESDIGKGQIALYFENSALRLPSAKKGFRKLAASNNWGRFPSSVMDGFFSDDTYDCLFRQTGSIRTKGPGFHDSVGQKRNRSGNFCSGQKNHGAGDFLLPHQMAPENMGLTNSQTEGVAQSYIDIGDCELVATSKWSHIYFPQQIGSPDESLPKSLEKKKKKCNHQKQAAKQQATR
ncbi:hypothetical protein Tco_0798296 [Tanacetum coccineum]